jgi:hypothetical protein
MNFSDVYSIFNSVLILMWLNRYSARTTMHTTHSFTLFHIIFNVYILDLCFFVFPLCFWCVWYIICNVYILDLCFFVCPLCFWCVWYIMCNVYILDLCYFVCPLCFWCVWYIMCNVYILDLCTNLKYRHYT